MKATVLEEPLLEFGGGARHVDPRYGVTHYGPADLNAPGSPRRINVGIVGTPDAISEVEQWLTSLRDPLPSRDPRRSGLWPSFPGFREQAGFRAEIVIDPRLERPIRSRDLEKVRTLDPRRRLDAAVDLFLDEIRTLADDANPHVIFCVLPDEIDELGPTKAADERAGDALSRETVDSGRPAAFHDVLKARAMPMRVPLQLIRGTTYDPSRARAQKRREWKLSEREDEATIAWNLLTAVYYKAGGSPWRMTRERTDLDTCFVGISFYRTMDGAGVATSVAQVYNQLGEGVVVRGGPAHRSEEDRQLHLGEADAHRIIKDAMRAYRREHRHPPARIVVHKTTDFDAAEEEGMLAARDELDLDLCELIWVTNSAVRLHRDGYHPPMRGTFCELDRSEALLYTRGSVDWFETYAGLYVPNPISLRPAVVERRMVDIATEVLALSKMNWNSSRFDGRIPVSIRTARRVADIIRHVPMATPVETKYGYYM